MPFSDSAPCPCGRQNARRQPLSLGDCCGRYLDHWDRPVPDAESLMRSRYSAFTQERADYLLATWVAEHRPAALDFDPGARWLGLEVRAQQATGEHRAEADPGVKPCGKGGVGRAHAVFWRIQDGQGLGTGVHRALTDAVEHGAGQKHRQTGRL